MGLESHKNTSYLVLELLLYLWNQPINQRTTMFGNPNSDNVWIVPYNRTGLLSIAVLPVCNFPRKGTQAGHWHFAAWWSGTKGRLCVCHTITRACIPMNCLVKRLFRGTTNNASRIFINQPHANIRNGLCGILWCVLMFFTSALATRQWFIYASLGTRHQWVKRFLSI